MTTYILGAGASCHAGYPLASELGVVVRNWIHETKPADHSYRIHVDALNELYGGLNDIERIITDLVMCEPGSRAASLERPIRANIRSDLRRSIRECFNDLRKNPAPLYQQFASERIKPGDAVISFNYDASCERELRRAAHWEIGSGYGFSLGTVALRQSPIEVLKLHGSTNWWALLFGGSTGFQQVANSIGERPVIFFDPDYEFLSYGPEVRDSACAGLRQVTGWPAIIMPTLQKTFYEQTSLGKEWEQFWEQLWGKAERALRESREIVIIGYSMLAVDQRARELLVQAPNRNAKVSVYCGRASFRICNQFRNHGFVDVQSSGMGMFEDYLAS